LWEPCLGAWQHQRYEEELKLHGHLGFVEVPKFMTHKYYTDARTACMSEGEFQKRLENERLILS